MAIIALITCYNPCENNICNIKKLSTFVDKLFVIDNSKDSHNFSYIKNILYIHSGENMGLSKSFNIVLKNNIFNDEDFIFFFDQDSSYEDDHIKIMVNEFCRLERNHKIGILSCGIFNLFEKRIILSKKNKSIESQTFLSKNVITSSMLTKYKILKLINFWDEDIFLDMADWSFSWKASKCGLKIFVTTKTCIYHTLGNGIKKRFGIRIDNCNTFREYYIIRDGLRLLIKNYVPFRKRIVLFYIIFIRSILHLLFLDKKKERFTYMIKGGIAFIFNRHGAINENFNSLRKL